MKKLVVFLASMTTLALANANTTPQSSTTNLSKPLASIRDVVFQTIDKDYVHSKLIFTHNLEKTNYKNPEIEGSKDLSLHQHSKYYSEFKIYRDQLRIGTTGNFNRATKEISDPKYWARVNFNTSDNYQAYLQGQYHKSFLYPIIDFTGDYQSSYQEYEYGVNGHLRYKQDTYPTPALTLKSYLQRDFGKWEDARIELEGQHRLNSVNGRLAESPFANGQIKHLGLQYLMSTLSSRYNVNRYFDLFLEGSFAYRFDNNTSKYGKDVQINNPNAGDHDHGHDHAGHNHLTAMSLSDGTASSATVTDSHTHASHYSSKGNYGYSDDEEEDLYARGFSHLHGYYDPNIGLEARLDRDNFAEEVADYYLAAGRYKWQDFEVLGKYKLYHRFRHNEIAQAHDHDHEDHDHAHEHSDVPATTHTFTHYAELRFKYVPTNFLKGLTVEVKPEAYYLHQNNSTIKNYAFELHGDVKYDYAVTDKLTLTPRLHANLQIDGSEYYDADLLEVPFFSGGIYRDFSNSANLTPSLTVKYKFTKNITLAAHAGFNVRFAGVHPDIYNPKFLAADKMLMELATANNYPTSGEKYNEFLAKLGNNEIKVTDETSFKALNSIYESLNGDLHEKEESGSGLLNSTPAL